MSEEEPNRLERHINSAEYWLVQADVNGGNFPSPMRTEMLELAAIHANLACALAQADNNYSVKLDGDPE